MYVGHFAAALVIQSRSEKTPLVPALVATGFVDYLYSAFVALGIEKTSNGHFLFIGWSHSVLMGLVWSMLFALLFYRQGPRVMLTLGVIVMSHTLLDMVVHEADIQLFPYSPIHFGLGLPIQAGWAVELIFTLGCLLLYFRANNPKQPFNRFHLGLAGFLIALHIARFALGV